MLAMNLCVFLSIIFFYLYISDIFQVSSCDNQSLFVLVLSYRRVFVVYCYFISHLSVYCLKLIIRQYIILWSSFRCFDRAFFATFYLNWIDCPKITSRHKNRYSTWKMMNKYEDKMEVHNIFNLNCTYWRFSIPNHYHL